MIEEIFRKTHIEIRQTLKYHQLWTDKKILLFYLQFIAKTLSCEDIKQHIDRVEILADLTSIVCLSPTAIKSH